MIDISVIVPAYNEYESLPELVEWINKVVASNNLSTEIVIIDDGSTDSTWSVISGLAANNDNVKGVKFRRNYGKAAALHIGFQQALGDVVITMDADLQDSPDEIPELYRMIKEDGFEIVSGWKKKRHDPVFTKNIPSKLYNWMSGKFTGIKLHDMNCGLKAYKNIVVKNIEVYGEMHRYIPVIAKRAGFSKIGEKVVVHRARQYGETKFGMSRFVNGFLDLLSISFMTKFGRKPMHIFGLIGSLMFFLGFISALWLGISKIIDMAHDIPARLVTDSPYFYISLILMVFGTQFFLSGFLGELITRNATDRNNYVIETEV